MNRKGDRYRKKSDFQKKRLGQGRTAVPREGVDAAILRVYENTVKEYLHFQGKGFQYMAAYIRVTKAWRSELGWRTAVPREGVGCIHHSG